MRGTWGRGRAGLVGYRAWRDIGPCGVYSTVPPDACLALVGSPPPLQIVLCGLQETSEMSAAPRLIRCTFAFGFTRCLWSQRNAGSPLLRSPSPKPRRAGPRAFESFRVAGSDAALIWALRRARDGAGGGRPLARCMACRQAVARARMAPIRPVEEAPGRRPSAGGKRHSLRVSAAESSAYPDRDQGHQTPYSGSSTVSVCHCV